MLDDADDTGWCRSGSELDGPSMLGVPSAPGVVPGATPSDSIGTPWPSSLLSKSPAIALSS